MMGRRAWLISHDQTRHGVAQKRAVANPLLCSEPYPGEACHIQRLRACIDWADRIPWDCRHALKRCLMRRSWLI